SSTEGETIPAAPSPGGLINPAFRGCDRELFQFVTPRISPGGCRADAPYYGRCLPPKHVTGNSEMQKPNRGPIMRASRVTRKSSLHPFTNEKCAVCNGRTGAAKPPGQLRYVREDAVAEMDPGDIILLEDTTGLRAQVDSGFYAILACPQCGHLDLITQAQYGGAVSVLCGHHDCSCHFKIHEKTRLAYLPIN
ncbi:MAG: hypothetical protein ACRD3T_11995, partial [Terriglobia bacterium]